MTLTNKTLLDPQYAPNVTAALYTAPTTAMITAFNATNISAAQETLTLYIVPSGGSAGDSNKILAARAIPPGESLQPHEVLGQVLESGGAIHVLASGSSVINVIASGVEFT